LGEQLAKSHHYGNLSPVGAYLLDCLPAPQCFGLVDGEALLDRQHFDWRLMDFSTPAACPVRLRYHQAHIRLDFEQLLQGRNGKVGGSKEY
jgi:hypothetical protein